MLYPKANFIDKFCELKGHGKETSGVNRVRAFTGHLFELKLGEHLLKSTYFPISFAKSGSEKKFPNSMQVHYGHLRSQPPSYNGMEYAYTFHNYTARIQT